MIVHLVDGTYELFRHFYGLKRKPASDRDTPLDAAVGVLGTVIEMIQQGATHIGVATDHVIESFRNDLWAEYKTGEGIEPALKRQFEPLEDGLRALGVATWAMVDFEADDALASAAHLAAVDGRVQKVCIWTPDKDLAQCVSGTRVVQADRRKNMIRDEAGVIEKFGVPPRFIPDYLALVGDSADGYPGIRGIGAKTAASLISEYGPIEEFPEGKISDVERALLFKTLATLRTDAQLFDDVDELKWRGPGEELERFIADAGAGRLAEKVSALVRD